MASGLLAVAAGRAAAAAVLRFDLGLDVVDGRGECFVECCGVGALQRESSLLHRL